MQTTQQLQQASVEAQLHVQMHERVARSESRILDQDPQVIVSRAREELRWVYAPEELATLGSQEVLNAWIAMVLAEAAAFVRAEYYFYG
jgi:hypothetical protein